MDINRRTFVRNAAGASSALAASSALGTAAEADPASAVDESEPAISYGGRTLESYAARPRAGTTRGGIVVVQAVWGVDAQLRDVVRRFAAAGYAAIAPNLYTGIGPASAPGQTDIAIYKTYAANLVDATVDADLAATADHLRANGIGTQPKIGVIGFCMGGAIALRQTVDTPSFAAASVFYGKVRYGTNGNEGPITPIALAYADEMRVPTVGSWGGKDTSILPADVEALDARLTALGKAHDFRVYPEAGHAFFDDSRSSYVPSAAADAWRRTLAWFGTHVG